MKTSKIVYDNIAFLCPKCHCIANVNKISINIKIDADDNNFRIVSNYSPGMIIPDVYFSSCEEGKMISRTCNKCKCEMFIIDKGIAPVIKKLNDAGLYTKFSCDGKLDSCPYIYFGMPAKRAREFLLEFVLSNYKKNYIFIPVFENHKMTKQYLLKKPKYDFSIDFGLVSGFGIYPGNYASMAINDQTGKRDSAQAETKKFITELTNLVDELIEFFTKEFLGKHSLEEIYGSNYSNLYEFLCDKEEE